MGENYERASWKDGITRSRKYGRGYEETKKRHELSIEKFGGYKTEVIEIIEERERQALRNKVKEEKHLQ